MMTHRLSRLLLASIAWSSVCAAQASHTTINDFLGKWVVTDVVDYADISGGIPEAKRILGMTMKIAPNAISFDKQTCKPNSGFTVREVDTLSELAKQFDLHVNETGLPVRTISLGSDNCFAVFRMDDQRIVFGWDGIIVRAVRSK